jgi:hypothetical protein
MHRTRGGLLVLLFTFLTPAIALGQASVTGLNLAGDAAAQAESVRRSAGPVQLRGHACADIAGGVCELRVSRQAAGDGDVHRSTHEPTSGRGGFCPQA